MADVTRNIHVEVVTFDPAQGKLIPVPGARLLCEDSGILWDPDLSDGTATTGPDGRAQVAVTYDDGEEDGLNPFFTVTVPAGSRSVPAGAPAERRVDLPGEWVTRHYAKRRIRRITDHADPNNPLRLFVGLPAHLRVSYSDFDTSGKRNPVALPQRTARIYLADFDTFIFDFLDFLNPDDTLTGKGFDPVAGRIVDFGGGDRYPYADVWPTVPTADDAPAFAGSWFDPPGAPVGALGGGSFTLTGRVATDPNGFVFAIDGDVIRRFYPDGTLCETIPSPTAVPLNAPKGIALDSYANLFVADTGSNTVRILSPRWAEGDSGRYAESAPPFGGAGAGNGQFNAPEGVAVIGNPRIDGPERLAVADTGNQRVQVVRIDVTGNNPLTSPRAHDHRQVGLAFVAAFGTSGAAAGQFNVPVGVGADRQGRVFVADQGLHRVSRWAPDAAGTAYVHQVDWEKAGGGAGAGPREFNTPADVAVDPNAGFLYVADGANNRVQRLDAESGAHLADWVLPGAGPGGRFTPGGVAVDARSDVYASDPSAPRIVRGTRFDRDSGAPLADATPPAQVGGLWLAGDDASHMRAPGYVAYGPDRRLWVADTGNDRVLSFERDAKGALTTPTVPALAGLSKPVGVAPDPGGGLFVVDGGNDRVRRYDAALAHQADLGSGGAGPDQFRGPRGIAVAQRLEPTLYVADSGNDRVQILHRDGTFTGRLTAGDGQGLKAPEDVAVDARGNVYVADTGNSRIVQFDANDAFVRAFAVPLTDVQAATAAAAEAGAPAPVAVPSGIAVDDEGKLIVTDRAQDVVFRFEADGTLLAYWDLKRFLRLEIGTPDRLYEPDLARQVRFSRPAKAVVDDRGLLTVADTGHDRVRLVRTSTRIDALLLDLGEGLPDVSLRAVTKDDYSAELGLKLNVGDVSIFDESQDFESEPIGDFSDDEIVASHMLTKTNSTNAAVNVMKAAREVQAWYKRLTRADDADHRWGTAETSHGLDVDLTSSDGSFKFLDLNLGEGGHDGRGSDAWDDSVIAHEMSHWVFFKACEPLPPFSVVGLLGLTRSHGTFLFTNFNQAINEGWSEFVALSWGSEFGTTDRVRGWSMTGGAHLTTIKPRGGSYQWLFGGASTGPPAFNDPASGLRAESGFSGFLYQLHRVLTDPGVLYADSPSFWYRYNSAVGDAQAKRFTDVIWKALRRFPNEPTRDQWDSASTVYLNALLAQAHTAQPDVVELVRSLMELNNQLMPAIELLSGTPDAPGGPLGATVTLQPGQARQVVARVKDATGRPMRGYHLRFTVGTAASYALPGGPGPVARHGRRPAAGAAVPANELHRATNAEGMVGLTFTAPPLPAGAAGANDVLRVSYQPDFDSDETFSPPAKGDDRETTLRRAYLHELRGAAKVWSGAGNNFGAEVAKSVTFRVQGA